MSPSSLLRKSSFWFLLGLLQAATAKSQTGSVTAESVKREFLHAWDAYKKYAWGSDALKPVSKTPHNWYRTSLCMTPVDAYDALVLMGLDTEAAEAKALILDSLSFDKDVEVQAFEITIRLLGGLLSAYQLDHDRRFLLIAEDLGRRLLPIYETPTSMPYRYVNLRSGTVRDSVNNPAEIGTALLELGTLSKLTGNPVYYEKAKRALVALFQHRSSIGLVGTWINVETGQWTNTSSHIGGAIDSYYEYLFKAWLLFGDGECKEMWDASIGAVNRFIADTVAGNLWYGRADMTSGKRTSTTFGSLEAFFPGLLCLAEDTSRARALQESSFMMWNLHDIEPEQMNYSTMTATAKQYHLRPEIIESAYYLYHFTGDTRFLRMGEEFFHSIVKYCKVESGYTYLEDVTTKQQADGMESFFFAETLKYLYLLFHSHPPFSLDTVVFTTEAHPIRNTWK